MGEYAIYQGRRVKIGTCEDLYYLRLDQVPLVQAEASSVDPRSCLDVLRFRFPWPDEDGLTPLGLHHPSVDFDRGELLGWAGYEAPHRDGCSQPLAAELVQQGWRRGVVAPVFRCAECRVRWSVPEFSDLAPVLGAMRVAVRRTVDTGDTGRAQWLSQVGRRLVAGYRRSGDGAVPLAAAGLPR